MIQHFFCLIVRRAVAADSIELALPRLLICRLLFVLSIQFLVLGGQRTASPPSDILSTGIAPSVVC